MSFMSGGSISNTNPKRENKMNFNTKIKIHLNTCSTNLRENFKNNYILKEHNL